MAERSEIEPLELHRLLSADGDGPAPRIDATAQARLIDGVLDAVLAGGAAQGAPAGHDELAPARAKKRSRKLAWSLAAAFAITGSAAAMYTAQRMRDAEADAERVGDATARRARAAEAPAAEAPAAEPVPAAGPRGDDAQNAAPEAPAVAAPAPRAAATPARVKPHAASTADARSDDLLRRANQLRGDGDYRAAERAYQQAVTENPRGAAAYAARVAAAGLRLERLSDARGALRLYGEALQHTPDGALSPEIHEGMANAYHKLGRARDEARMLRALLREQPSGPAAERARARLAVLDAQP
jgi:tetratricopeptide (TPR) repeat protein